MGEYTQRTPATKLFLKRCIQIVMTCMVKLDQAKASYQKERKVKFGGNGQHSISLLIGPEYFEWKRTEKKHGSTSITARVTMRSAFVNQKTLAVAMCMHIWLRSCAVQRN